MFQEERKIDLKAIEGELSRKTHHYMYFMLKRCYEKNNKQKWGE